MSGDLRRRVTALRDELREVGQVQFADDLTRILDAASDTREFLGDPTLDSWSEIEAMNTQADPGTGEGSR